MGLFRGESWQPCLLLSQTPRKQVILSCGESASPSASPTSPSNVCQGYKTFHLLPSLPPQSVQVRGAKNTRRRRRPQPQPLGVHTARGRSHPDAPETTGSDWPQVRCALVPLRLGSQPAPPVPERLHARAGRASPLAGPRSRPRADPPCPPPAGDAAPRHLPADGAAGVPARCCSAAARALAGPGAGQGALVTPPPERPSRLRGRPPRSPRPAPRPLPLRPRSSPALPARLPLGPGQDPPRAPATGRRKVAGRGAEHQPRAARAGILRLTKLKIENDPSEGKDQGHSGKRTSSVLSVFTLKGLVSIVLKFSFKETYARRFGWIVFPRLCPTYDFNFFRFCTPWVVCIISKVALL